MALSALTLSSVDEQIKLLGVAPQVLPRLQDLLSDGNTNPDDILDLIRLDTALATRVIKVSNAAYYSRGSPIATIEEAVTYLGYDEVYCIMSMLAFGKMMKAPLKYFGFGLGDLWRRALATALAMDGLATVTDVDRRVAYTIGLVHAIGMIFVDGQLTANKAAQTAGASESEVRLLGLTHADVGAYVLRQWNFPEQIMEPVRCQFEPLDCLANGRLACVLHTAKVAMRHIVRPTGIPAEPPAPDALVLAMLNISGEDYSEVLAETEGRFTLLEIATSDM